MDTGLDSESLQAFKQKLDRLASNAGRLKLIITGILLVGGILGLCRPQIQRIAEARHAIGKIEKKAKTAKDAKYLTRQKAIYEDRVWPRSDAGDWQDYVMGILKETDVELRRLNPRRQVKKGAYKLVELDVVVNGETPALLELLDRLERGERLLRITNFNLERGRDGVLVLSCVAIGLAKAKAGTKGGGASTGKGTKKAKADTDNPSGKAASTESPPEVSEEAIDRDADGDHGNA